MGEMHPQPAVILLLSLIPPSPLPCAPLDSLVASLYTLCLPAWDVYHTKMTHSPTYILFRHRCHHASGWHPPPGFIDEFSLEDCQELFTLNFYSVYNMCRIALP